MFRSWSRKGNGIRPHVRQLAEMLRDKRHRRRRKEAGGIIMPGNDEKYFKEVDIPNGVTLKKPRYTSH